MSNQWFGNGVRIQISCGLIKDWLLPAGKQYFEYFWLSKSLFSQHNLWALEFFFLLWKMWNTVMIDCRCISEIPNQMQDTFLIFYYSHFFLQYSYTMSSQVLPTPLNFEHHVHSLSKQEKRTKTLTHNKQNTQKYMESTLAEHYACCGIQLIYPVSLLWRKWNFLFSEGLSCEMLLG